ncbi:hypothetical protein R84B8_00169 [Treponema sp. R8-4-B8]
MSIFYFVMRYLLFFYKLYIVDKKYEDNLSEKMREKIDNPAYSDITYCKGMNRFTLRTERKVGIQMYAALRRLGLRKTLVGVTLLCAFFLRHIWGRGQCFALPYYLPQTSFTAGTLSVIKSGKLL